MQICVSGILITPCCSVSCRPLQLEIDDPKELTEEYIYDEVHPKVNVARQAFAKPKGPAGRGPKRMTKPT